MSTPNPADEAAKANHLLTPRFRAIYDEAVKRANEQSKVEFGESIYARGLRDWAKHKGLNAPPQYWPRGFSRVAGFDKRLWQPFDWNGNPIGEPWQFKCDIADDNDLCLNVWGDVTDDRVCFFDPCGDPDYFGNMGWVLDATVDPQRYTAVLIRLFLWPPTPPDASAAA